MGRSLRPNFGSKSRWKPAPQALDAVWEEEQIKFLGEQSCASGEEAARQKHFAGAVAPQYLNLDDTPAGEPRK